MTHSTSPITSLFASPPEKQYSAVTSSSQYLTMRDGTHIAVDVMLPRDLAPDARVPVVLIMARYWRSMALRVPDQPGKALIGPREPVAPYLLARGFAVVVVDGRGSGASTGVSRFPWSPEELTDYGEVASWAAAQPWSNGSIGAFGVSYEGATALRLAGQGVSAVRGVVPQEIEYDVYTDVALPGGIFNVSFIRAWNESNQKLDNNTPSSLFPTLARLLVKGVRLVDSDRKTRTMLTQALRDHQANTDVYQAISQITYRDDPFGETGVTLDDFSLFTQHTALEQSCVPLFTWGSWLDATTADAVLRMFNTFSAPQTAVIGAWKHEMTAHGSPYRKPKSAPDPLKEQQWAALAQFFTQTLVDNQPPQRKCLYYYTLGEEVWKQTDMFPLPNTDMQTWYFQSANRLAPSRSTAESEPDTYAVDFTATTGKTNRWNTQMAQPVVYQDRTAQDRHLLTYTSAPLEHDMEITGYSVVMLHVASSADDGAFFVYLEDVDEHGVVRYITEGELRGIHRRLSTQPAPMWTGMPYRTFTRADASPLPVGETVELTIGLQPTSVLIRQGHAIRVAIAGADQDTFVRIPAQGSATWHVSHSGAFASCIHLPVVRRA